VDGAWEVQAALEASPATIEDLDRTYRIMAVGVISIQAGADTDSLPPLPPSGRMPGPARDASAMDEWRLFPGGDPGPVVTVAGR